MHSIRRRLADPDGISAKAVIDGLNAEGLFADDSTKFIEEIWHKQIKSSEEKTVVEIEGI